jgi:protein phosphatase
MTERHVHYQQIRGVPRAQQDALLVGNEVIQGTEVTGETPGEGVILVGVADGVASSPNAARMSRRLLACVADAYWTECMAFNARLIRRAQSVLSAAVQSRQLRHESACTVVLAEIKDGTVTVLNTGDSRAYLIRRETGEFRRLSRDHTSFQLLKDDGAIPQDAQDCDYGSVATGLLDAVRAAPMGDQDFPVHMDYTRIKDDEVALLCSDGVTAHLRDREIAQAVVSAEETGMNACQHITDLVRERGASDNTTVVLVAPR